MRHKGNYVKITLLILLSVVGRVLCREAPCTFTGPSGNYYDLSPLSFCDHSGYPVDGDGSFQINICNSVNTCGGGAAAVCQGGGYNCGNVASTAFSELSDNSGVVISYSNGDACPNGQGRKSVITLTCDSNANTPVFSFTSENPQCVYNFAVRTKEACPKQNGPQIQLCLVNVFLVPHTHDDVGWLNTVDGYYQSQVKKIIDSAVASLIANPERKFIYVEQAFFTRWWYDPNTSDQQRAQLQSLVRNRQWEFVLGGWVMPDEAATTYGAVIDQLTLGHQFLLNTFSVTPTKGWQIDPFGASSVTPVIYRLAGFDGHIIDRITNKDLYQRNQALEFYWRGSPTLGKNNELFSEIMGGGGYCDWLFDFNFDNDPVNPGNVADYGKKFEQIANDRTGWYKTPNLLAEWGCDFAFQTAQNNFNSMDKVIAWLGENEAQTGIRVSYRTLSEYFASVQNYSHHNNIVFPVNEGGDYFTYFANLWWTGYFTSRVELKGFVRQGEAVSHVVEPLYSLGRLLVTVDSKSTYANISILRSANGQAQHHDGVTGTSVPEVVQMYKDDIIIGIDASLTVGASVLSLLINKNPSSPPPTLFPDSSALLNLSPGGTSVIIVINPLGWTRSEVVSIPVNSNTFSVFNSNGVKVLSQVLPSVGGNSTSNNILYFQAANIPPIGFSTFFVTVTGGDTTPARSYSDLADTVLENSVLRVNISSATRRISSIQNKKSGVVLSVDQNLYSYVSMQSGAYAFTPAGPAVPFSQGVPTNVFNSGPVFSEVYQTFSNTGKQTIRLYKSISNSSGSDIENFIEISHDVGPLPSHTEVVTRFTTSINNGPVFTVDANGYQLMERKYEWSTGIGSNFYPMVYSASIKDSLSQISLISERSHGASSVDEGLLEVMIHRNPDMGDGFGPGLTDTTEVYPSFRVLLDTPLNSPPLIHKQSYLMNFPLVAFSATTSSPSGWLAFYQAQGQFLTSDLPPNIHIQSLSALDDSTSKVILRLVHIYAKGEDPVLSLPVTINFSTLFNTNLFSISSIVETTVSANKVIGNVPALVQINPSEIRTFVVTFAV